MTSKKDSVQLGADLASDALRGVSRYVNDMSHGEKLKFWAAFSAAMFGACAASVGTSDAAMLISVNLDVCREVALERAQ